MPQPDSTFYAVDVQTGKRVSTFCVGRPVRFEQTVGRNIPSNFLYYGVKAGTGAAADFPACTPSTTPNAPFVYTPSRADVGTVTVAELTVANPPSTLGSTYYVRTFQVYDNVAPAFTVAPCPNNNAHVTITDATYDRYEIQAGTGAVITILPVPGQAKVRDILLNGATSITVRGYYNAPNLCESQPSTQTVAPILPAQTPLLTTFTLQAPLPGGTATLAIGQLPVGYIYTLQREAPGAPGVYTTVSRVRAGSTSFLLGTVLANNGYRLLRADTCNGPTAASEQLYPISLSGTSAQNRNQLLFSDGSSLNPTNYTVKRDGVTIPVTVIPGGLEDATGICGTRYRYQVTATYPKGGQSISNEFYLLTQSNLLPAQPRLLASFNERNVVVLTPLRPSPPLPSGSTLYYRKASGGSAPAAFATTTTLRPQRDSTALADLRAAPPCYSLRQADVCGNNSPESASTCPALLSAAPADADGSTATLTWTPFTGPDPSQPASYVLQVLGPDFNLINSTPVSGGTYTDLVPPRDRQVLRYRLQISGAGLPAGTFSYSNIATVTRRLFLNLPTAFTPNGDGVNDVLEVKGKYLDNYTFVVVDRNGQEVFRGTKRADVWDGTIRGHAPVLGAYVWRFSQTNEDGTPFTATGTVTILK